MTTLVFPCSLPFVDPKLLSAVVGEVVIIPLVPKISGLEDCWLFNTLRTFLRSGGTNVLKISLKEKCSPDWRTLFSFLLTNTELFSQRTVFIDVSFSKIVQQLTTLTYQS